MKMLSLRSTIAFLLYLLCSVAGFATGPCGSGPAAPVITLVGTPCLGSDTLVLTGASSAMQISWFDTGTQVAVISGSTVSTVAGGNGSGSASNQFSQAAYVYVDNAGYIYVTDVLNNRIQKFPPGSTSATSGVTVAGGNGQGSAANQLYWPNAVFVDSAGYLYVADGENNRIQKFSPGSTSATNGVTVAGGNGSGSAANQFNGGDYVLVDGQGNIYVADNSNNRVQKFPPGSTSATNGVTIAGGNGQGGAANQLWGPTGIALDSAGNLYVADYYNFRVQKFPAGSTSASSAVTVAGGYGQGSGLNQLNNPDGIFLDAAGDLYVADYLNNRIQEFPSGSTSATYATTVAGGNGSGTGTYQFRLPNALYVDSAGAMYIADGANNRIQKWVSGTLSQFSYSPAVAGIYTATYYTSAGCTSSLSNGIRVGSSLAPAVSVTASSIALSPGSADTFTAIPVYGGSAPVYQWHKNGVNVGTNSSIYIASPVFNADRIWVTMTSTLACASPDTAVSNQIYIFAPASQSPAIGWARTYGGTYIDFCHAAIPTRDQCYVLAGESKSSDGDLTSHHGNYTTPDYWLVKIDTTGAIIWQKNLGGSSSDVCNAVKQTSDGGYILAGSSASSDGDVTGNQGNWDYWIVKVDSLGNIMWEKTLGTSDNDEAYDIVQTRDGGYLVSGYVGSSAQGNIYPLHLQQGGTDIGIAKLDSAGNRVWFNTYGGPGDEGVNRMIATYDGGYILAAYTSANGGDVTGYHGGQDDAWIVKIDSTGALQWQKTVGGSSTDAAFDIIQLADSSYVIAGGTESIDGDIVGHHGNNTIINDAWIFQLSQTGTLLWQKCLGGTGDEVFNKIYASHGSYIATGATTSVDGDVIPGDHGSNDLWTVKLGLTGEILWQKVNGGSLSDGGGVIIPAWGSKGYLAATSTMSNDGDVSGNHGDIDIWVVAYSDTCHPVYGSVNDSICRGYAYNGHRIAGTYTDTFTNKGGCDSIVTLTLTIKNGAASSYSQSICAGSQYIFAGRTLTSTGTYYDTLTAGDGCDSIVTLTLTVNIPSRSAYAQSICPGSSYIFGGDTLRVPGTYRDTLTAGSGCDSIVTLTLTIPNTLTTAFSHSMCAGSSYVFGGHALILPGIYSDTLTAASGCDSIVMLTLTVNNMVANTISHSICAGSSYLFGSHSLTTAGIYVDTLTSSGGCDSVITLHLSLDTVTAYFTLRPAGPLHVWDIVNLCTGRGLDYSWSWGDGTAHSTGDTPSHTYTSAGYYNVCVDVADSSGCVAAYCDSNAYLYKTQADPMVYVNVVLTVNGIADVNTTGLIHLYPNPASEFITLSVGAEMIGSSYAMSDMTGRIIAVKMIEKDNTVIPLKQFSSGIYLLQVNHQIYKIVKE